MWKWFAIVVRKITDIPHKASRINKPGHWHRHSRLISNYQYKKYLIFSKFCQGVWGGILVMKTLWLVFILIHCEYVNFKATKASRNNVSTEAMRWLWMLLLSPITMCHGGTRLLMLRYFSGAEAQYAKKRKKAKSGSTSCRFGLQNDFLYCFCTFLLTEDYRHYLNTSAHHIRRKRVGFKTCLNHAGFLILFLIFLKIDPSEQNLPFWKWENRSLNTQIVFENPVKFNIWQIDEWSVNLIPGKILVLQNLRDEIGLQSVQSQRIGIKD